MLNGCRQKKSSPVGPIIFKGHFFKSKVTNLSTFIGELLSICSSTVVYDIQFCSSESLLLSNVNNPISNFAT